VLLLCTVLQSAATGQAQSDAGDFVVSTDQFWTLDFAAPPRICVAGDADGDGRADLLSLWPQGEALIDFSLTSPWGKPVVGMPAFTSFGREAVAVTCGSFADRDTAEVLAVFADGSVRVAWGGQRTGSVYRHNDEAVRIPSDHLPKRPMTVVAGDFTGDGRTDACLVSADGSLVVLENTRSGDGPPRLAVRFVEGTLPEARRIAAGRLGDEKAASLVWLDIAGKVYRTSIQLDSGGAARVIPSRQLASASPGEGLAVGRFLGRSGADVLIGSKLLPGGDPARGFTLPALAETAAKVDDFGWLAADFDGNGQDDLLFRRDLGRRLVTADTWHHHELRIHFSAHRGDERQGYLDGDGDGLLDEWESGQVKPAGLDLPGLGCAVGRRDMIVEISRFDDVPLEAVQKNMSDAAQYLASLPLENRDRSQGIAMHVVYRDVFKQSDRDRAVRDVPALLPREHRGIVHFALLDNHGTGGGYTIGGLGGVSRLANSTPVFLHELGHQLDLRHDGYWQAEESPLYTSLMNYSYGYGFDNRPSSWHYSDGRYSSVVLNERDLSERLPFPFEELHYLHAWPYQFPIRRGPGRTTLVDWNRNGVFGEEHVAADINYRSGTDPGRRHPLARAHTAPAVVAHGDGEQTRLLVFYGRSPDPNAHNVDLSPERPGALFLRIWSGTDCDAQGDDWSREIEIENGGLAGDPTAAYVGGATWLAYATSAGVAIRRITFDDQGPPRIEASKVVPDTQNVQPTLGSWHRHLAMLLWRSAAEPVGLRVLAIDKTEPKFQEEHKLSFHSLVPPATVPGADDPRRPALWVARLEGDDPQRRGQPEVRCIVPEPSHSFREVERHWIGGIYFDGSFAGPREKYGERRMALAWREEAGFNKGRLYHVGLGPVSDASSQPVLYLAMQVADRSFGGGWLTRHFQGADSTPQSAVGACWLGDDLVVAFRHKSGDANDGDMLSLSFHGLGIHPRLMGDFDDVGWIRDGGLFHSVYGMFE
jgi:hypothetical protein